MCHSFFKGSLLGVLGESTARGAGIFRCVLGGEVVHLPVEVCFLFACGVQTLKKSLSRQLSPAL